MEKPVDDICMAADHVSRAITITRNCLGLWNLSDGRLLKTLSSSGSSIISQAKITSNGLYIVSAELGKFIYYNDKFQWSKYILLVKTEAFQVDCKRKIICPLNHIKYAKPSIEIDSFGLFKNRWRSSLFLW